MPASKDREREEKQEHGPSLLEWSAALVGALIAIGMLVFLAAEALRSGSAGAPLLEVRPTGIVEGQGLYVVTVEVANRSTHTAAAVEIQGELKQGGRVVETSSATVTYVPGHSRRQAGLIFIRDPRRYQAEVRAIGYARP